MKIALVYCDYLVERVAAVDEEIGSLDMSAQVEHFHSTGWDEPIVSIGMKPKNRVVDRDVPGWLIAGIERGMKDGRWGASEGHSAKWYAAEIFLNGGNSWVAGLAVLARTTKLSKFHRSIADFFVSRGEITVKQSNALLNPPHWAR